MGDCLGGMYAEDFRNEVQFTGSPARCGLENTDAPLKGRTTGLPDVRALPLLSLVRRDEGMFNPRILPGTRGIAMLCVNLRPYRPPPLPLSRFAEHVPQSASGNKFTYYCRTASVF